MSSSAGASDRGESAAASFRPGSLRQAASAARELGATCENVQVLQAALRWAANDFDRAVAELERVIDVHHRTLTGSNLHRAEDQEWTDCACRTCQSVASLTGAKS